MTDISTLFINGMPEQYRNFVISLWHDLETELSGTFINMRPDPVNNKRQPTLLESRRSLLEKIAASSAIRIVAKKADKTDCGKSIMWAVTKAALKLPEIIAAIPHDLEEVQSNRIEVFLAHLTAIRALINDDLSPKEAMVPGLSEDKYNNSNTMSIEPSLSINNYRYALVDVVGDNVRLDKLFIAESVSHRAALSKLTGSTSPYKFGIIINSLEAPLQAKLNDLREIVPRSRRAQSIYKRLAYMLWDVTEPFADYFIQKHTSPLKRVPLVTAFLEVLSDSSFPHDENLRNVHKFVG